MEETFTNSIASDIILLSSFLSSKGITGPSELEPTGNTALNLLSDISRLLDSQNTANSANAVAGNIGSDSISCLVLKASPNNASKTRFYNRSSQLSIILNPKEGAQLLDAWYQHQA